MYKQKVQVNQNTMDRTFEVEIPDQNPSSIYEELQYQFDSPVTLKKYPDTVGSSFIGRLFSIEYELEIYIKHENQKGPISFASFPLRIH